MVKSSIFEYGIDKKAILSLHDPLIWDSPTPPVLTGELILDPILENPKEVPSGRHITSKERKIDVPGDIAFPPPPTRFRIDFTSDEVLVSIVRSNRDWEIACELFVHTRLGDWVVVRGSNGKLPGAQKEEESVLVLTDENEVLNWLVENEVLFDGMWPMLLNQHRCLDNIVRLAIREKTLDKSGMHPNHRPTDQQANNVGVTNSSINTEEKVKAYIRETPEAIQYTAKKIAKAIGVEESGVRHTETWKRIKLKLAEEKEERRKCDD